MSGKNAQETSDDPAKLNSRLPRGVKPYDWALKQMNVPQAHRITKGDENVIVAVIDIGYRHHRAIDGHLWMNPKSTRGDRHGWDYANNDASLEYTGHNQDSSYYLRGHHVFIAGEVATVAPKCPIMVLRIAYGAPDSWWQAIHYAVDNGAKVLVIPHGYITGEHAFGSPMYYMGTDFTYPFDNPAIRQALDYSYDHGCLTVRGVSDNKGRRAGIAMSAIETVLSVGTANRCDQPADICASADYVEIGAPGGSGDAKNDRELIWGCGGDDNYIPFSGGCMSSGFGGAAAALLWSRFPDLTNDQIRQLLRNTARPAKNVKPNQDGWESKLGYGIVNVAKAVALKEEQLCRNAQIISSSINVLRKKGKYLVEARIRNKGAFDGKAMVVVYNGNPAKPVDPKGNMRKSAPHLQTKQIGHTITTVRGLHESPIAIELIEKPADVLWFETFCLDRHDAGHVHRGRKNTAL